MLTDRLNWFSLELTKKGSEMPKHIKTPTERKQEHIDYLLRKANFTGVKSSTAKSFERFVEEELHRNQENYRRFNLL